jgi:hypothetical protein
VLRVSIGVGRHVQSMSGRLLCEEEQRPQVTALMVAIGWIANKTLHRAPHVLFDVCQRLFLDVKSHGVCPLFAALTAMRTTGRKWLGLSTVDKNDVESTNGDQPERPFTPGRVRRPVTGPTRKAADVSLERSGEFTAVSALAVGDLLRGHARPQNESPASIYLTEPSAV